MLRSSRLTLLLAVLCTACNPLASDDSGPEVCRPQERRVLVAEQLSSETPSTPFDVTGGDDVWVGVVADSDVSPSAPFSQVAGLYVIDEGDAVEYTRNDVDFVVTDDPYIDFDGEGQFVRFEFPAGGYQLWSIKSPEISVVVCSSDDG